jgi:DNA helicase II / ATP-dependent DNA helicase PcrA
MIGYAASNDTSGVSGLTEQQRLAIGTRTERLFIEAGPGTGKTTVSAHRFGVHRFESDARRDQRAVVAVSFTRAATLNLVRRVQRLWGRRAVTWPHRVVTLDTIMCDLAHDLLQAGLLRWPNGHMKLRIEDSWASFSGSTWNRTRYWFTVAQGLVQIHRGFVASPRSSVPATVSAPLLAEGICTHQDIRDVLELAIADPSIATYIRDRLGATIRALIVDEVFDANDLDIRIIETAVEAGVAVTLVGDPWQALYVFRGARPEVVPLLLERRRFRTLPLTQSFRWQHPGQQRLAEELRAGQSGSLPVTSHETDLAGLDVVLALRWKGLWDLGPGVLPLAFHAFKGGHEEAAATLLLNHVTRSIFSLDATYLNNAMTALAITDHDVPRQIEPQLQEIAETLRAGGKASVAAAYAQMAALVERISPRRLRAAHHNHTRRLALIQNRLAYPGRPVPGLTTHQAKGGEWEAVGVRLTADERNALAAGLKVERDTDRKLYVACTRAHLMTTEVT